MPEAQDDPLFMKRVSRLYIAYGPRLFRFFRKRGLDAHKAADFAQEVFARYARATRPDNGMEEQYLFRTAVNLLNEHFRRSQGDCLDGSLPYDEAPGEQLSSESDFDASDIADLHRCVGRLSLSDQALVWLHFAGFRDAEIAQRVGVTTSAVRNRFVRIRVELQRMLLDNQVRENRR
jgi:RNA polymerase sigma factor (sigma-70 family)